MFRSETKGTLVYSKESRTGMITCGRTAVPLCMCMCVCESMCVLACMRVCVHACVCTCACVYSGMFLQLYMCTHVCMCVLRAGCARVCMCVHVCSHVHAPAAVVCYPNVKVLCPAPAQELCSIGIIYKASDPRKPAHVAP